MIVRLQRSPADPDKVFFRIEVVPGQTIAASMLYANKQDALDDIDKLLADGEGAGVDTLIDETESPGAE